MGWAYGTPFLSRQTTTTPGHKNHQWNHAKGPPKKRTTTLSRYGCPDVIGLKWLVLPGEPVTLETPHDINAVEDYILRPRFSPAPRPERLTWHLPSPTPRRRGGPRGPAGHQWPPLAAARGALLRALAGRTAQTPRKATSSHHPRHWGSPSPPAPCW